MAQAMLDDTEALRIIQLHLEGNLEVRLEADFFGVSPETIRRIARRDTYRHLESPGGDRKATRASTRTQQQAAEIDESLKKLMQQLEPDAPVGNAFE